MRAPVTAALALALATGTACGGAEPVPEQALSGAIEVTVEPARLSLLRHVVTANGEIAPHPDADWTVHATETALIAELPLNERDPVETGDLVVRFEVPSRTSAIQAAEFDLEQATTRIARAKTRVNELTKLFESGLTARVELDSAKSELATAETTLAAVAATLTSLRAAETRDVVRARFPGIVLKRYHYQGDLVMSTGTDPVMRIVDPARTQVTLDVPVTEAGKLMPGQRVTITSLGSAPIVSTITAVAMASSPDATTIRVIVALPTQPAQPTQPTQPTQPAIGDAVIGEVLIAEVAEAMVVPTRAILRATGTPYVLVAGADGRVGRRDLRLGVATTELTQVLEGLQVGEFVITSALNEISEGDLVRHRQ